MAIKRNVTQLYFKNKKIKALVNYNKKGETQIR